MLKKHRILLVDQDQQVRQKLTCHLSKAGYEVVDDAGQADVFALMFRTHPDLVLLEWSALQDPEELLALIRQVAEIPILLMMDETALAEWPRAKEMGASSHFVKPISEHAVLEQVHKHLGRSRKSPEAVRIDLESHLVFRGSQIFTLTQQEFALLELLVRNEGKPVSAERLARTLWESADRLSQRDNLKHYVWRLRRKIEIDPHHPQYLGTVRGAGYRLQMAAQDRPEKGGAGPSGNPGIIGTAHSFRGLDDVLWGRRQRNRTRGSTGDESPDCLLACH